MIDMDLDDITTGPQRAIAWAVGAAIALGIAFGSGYAYKAHRVSVAAAEVKGQQHAVQAPVTAASTAIDKSAIKRRDAAIATTQQRTVYVTRLIEKESHENPAPADCRLPDRLRDEINRDLAADRPEPADPL